MIFNLISNKIFELKFRVKNVGFQKAIILAVVVVAVLIIIIKMRVI